MSDTNEQRGFRRVVLVVLEGQGGGATGVASGTPDRGCDTLGHVSVYMGGLSLPILQWLGLGNAVPMRGVDRAEPPAASYGTLRRTSDGTDLEGALAEMLGGTLERLIDIGFGVAAVGRAVELLDEDRYTRRFDGVGPDGTLAGIVQAMDAVHDGVVVAVIGGADGEPVAAGGPVGLARLLQRLDARLPIVLDALGPDTLFVLTAGAGADATVSAGARATRELVPVLAYTPLVPSGVELGRDGLFSNIGATLVETFRLDVEVPGQSFYGPILA